MERVAQCHCGSLRAIASEDPSLNYLCHCKACQCRTGAVLHSGMYFLKKQLKMEGPSKVYTRIADSGFSIHFYPCPSCGTSVYWDSEKRPDHLGVAVGYFADPSFPAPSFSVWEESRHQWLGMPSNTDHFDWGINADGKPMTRPAEKSGK